MPKPKDAVWRYQRSTREGLITPKMLTDPIPSKKVKESDVAKKRRRQQALIKGYLEL